MKKIYGTVACCLALSGHAAPQEASFEEMIDEATRIATKTKLNADYVPGTVTIVTGEELKALGVTNLASPNALDMIVGMDTIGSSLRGSGPWYGSNGNKIKWMINDRVIETENRSTDDWAKGPVLIPLPVEMVDRIEVVRGPGSALYGGNAIFGVVNIVTKQHGSGVIGGVESLGGSHRTKQGGAYTSFGSGALTGMVSVARSVSDGYDLSVGTEGHFWSDINSHIQLYGYAPGKLPLSSLTTSAMADLAYNDTKIYAYRFETQLGQGYDWIPTDALPPDNGSIAKRTTMTLAGIEHPFEAGGVTVTPKIGISRYDNPATYFKWPGSSLPRYVSPGYSDLSLPPFDAYRFRQYGEQKGFAQVDGEWHRGDHTMVGGLFIQQTRILTDNVQTNYDYPISTLWHGRGNTNGLFDYEPVRVQKAAYVQDQWDLNDVLTLTAGARYDTYSDAGSAVSPRIAAVWRLNEHHILKGQYARAFRAPSLYEDYGYMSPSVQYNNKSRLLKSETVDTYELAHIYKVPNFSFKTTVFHSIIYDMITQHDHSYIYFNADRPSILQGAEFEAGYMLPYAKITANAAFYKNHHGTYQEPSGPVTYTMEGGNFALAPTFLGNIAVTFNPTTAYPTTLWYHYTGAKPHRDGDLYNGTTLFSPSNGSIDPQSTLNITQQIKMLGDDLELALGVRNLFDTVQTTLYAPLSQPNSADIPYARRSMWMNLHYRF